MSRNLDFVFVDSLYEKFIKAIIQGKTKFLLWEASPEGLALIGRLQSQGLVNYLVGIIDLKPDLCGRSLSGIEIFPLEKISMLDFDTIIVANDENKEAILEELLVVTSPNVNIIIAGSKNYIYDDQIYHKILSGLLVKSKAGGYPAMLIHIFQSIKYICERELIGDLAEFGIYKAGTTMFIARTLDFFKHPGQVYGFDTFGGFPQMRGILDIFYDKKYEDAEYCTVADYCSGQKNITLVPGDITDTCKILKDKNLVFSFFDTDNYSGTRVALELCAEQTLQGGVIAFDHFYSPEWEETVGERIAAKQVLTSKTWFNLYQTGIFIKI